ncbi:HAMP domain-containing protein [Candidatus Poribacteria bacterium]|nr:HAMP domain-containing protein [Candidatus Poribacteria bacterium]MYK95696.1 HAMP domain-containing protein [Candidatus Poribacteria bacterium]
MKDKNRTKRFQFKVGLRGQQVVLFLLVALMPLFAISLAIKVLGESALKGTVGENHVLLAQEKLARADNAISEKIAKIEAELPNIRPAVVRSNTADGKEAVFFNIWAQLMDNIRILETYAGDKTEVTITNASGHVLRSKNNQELEYYTRRGAPRRVNNTTWWQSAYNQGVGYSFAEDIRYDASRGVHLLPIALPIRTASKTSAAPGEKNTVGVLRIMLLLPELKNIVESSLELEETHTILTSESGQIIAASPSSGYRVDTYIEMNNAAEEAIIEAKKGEQGKYYDYEADGETDSFNEPRVYGWARTRPSPTEPWKVRQNFSNWIVFISRPTSFAYAGVVELNNYIFYVTIVSSCIVVLIAWWAAQRIATPILKVAEGARSIGRGEFDSEIVVDSDDEVGVLAEEFNEMRRNLKAAVDKLTQEERKLTAIVDNLGEGLIVVEPSGRVLYVNPVAERLLNLGETSDYENFVAIDTETGAIHWTKMVTSTDGAPIRDTRAVDMKVLSASQREMAQHQTMIVEVNINGHQSNSNGARVLRIIASHFPDESNNTAGTVYVFDDITNEHEIEQMKSEFVSLVSHELRTPLTSIIGFISLILDGKTGEINQKQYESLSRAHRQSKRLAALINDLLDISRIEAGRIEMKQEQLQIDSVARRRIEELRPQADEKAISLRLETPSHLTTMIGDADRIGQIFINLIGNAIKFTPDSGKVTVRISESSAETPHPDDQARTTSGQNGRENDGFHVEVIDTGPGIPAEEREKVFDKFRQLGSVQTRQQGGTGLGLSIASGIVEAHGGKLWVDTGDNGRGCNFQFFIPFS